jgi:hypothetical protein
MIIYHRKISRLLVYYSKFFIKYEYGTALIYVYIMFRSRMITNISLQCEMCEDRHRLNINSV